MKKRYAIIGLGHRSQMFSTAILGRFQDTAELVALCDVNQTRMDYYNGQFVRNFGVTAIPTYKADDFARMIAEQKVDTIIVTTVDRVHHEYIIWAMELGCDVVTEKPMTIDATKCQAIIDAQKRTGKKLTVTFNYRYSPHASKVKQLLMQGAIGQVISVHFEWMLDTRHGADYFRRWHRDKSNSGGLMVHKATHHFDLINWWLDSEPETVFGMGQLAFYGRANAERRGQQNTYARAYGSPEASNDPFALHLERNPQMKALFLEAEHEDGYFRDQGVFSEGITTEDDMAVMVRYKNGATMSYHLTAYSPWEGLRVMFNGTQGRLELSWVESAYNANENDEALVDGVGDYELIDYHIVPEVVLRPHWHKPMKMKFEWETGGHGGGDVRLLTDIFGIAPPDPLKRAAGHRDGAMSILTGIAANKSFETGLPVQVSELVQF
ncbi:MAG: Gfo/Idh/MocA family oxidoreductase [Chloroflexi bacterium]|jgi:predicted dehydrogenase|nr:Gfo/Idh/MocA family oxidoreductase [Chloroflexota bacterium]